MKDPVKLACKELPKFGGVLVHKHQRGAVFDLPNGGRWQVTKGTRLADVRGVIDSCYLLTLGLRGYTAVVNPGIRPEQLRTSQHFLERLELMHEQVGVTMREVLEALADPVRVLANHNGRKLAVLGRRVAPIVVQSGTGELVLLTLYWSTAELWERYPRPEKGIDDV